MANELAVSGLAAGLAVYAIVRNSSGQVWSTTGTPGFVPQVAGNIADYDIAMGDTGSTGVYFGDMPAAPAGYLSAEYRVRSGGSPAWTDAVVGVETHQWSGTAWTSGGASAPTAAEVADAVWDEVRSGHVAADSFGEALQTRTGQITSATSSTVTLPAPYETGLAVGRMLVVNHQARVLGTHAGGGSYAIAPNWTTTPSASDNFWLGGYALDAAALRSAVGLAAANVDTQLSAISAKTANLPASFPANFAALAITGAGLVSLNLAQASLTVRDLSGVADAGLTVGDALVSAIVIAAGDASVSGTTYTLKTPAGTTTAVKTLDSATAPTAKT